MGFKIYFSSFGRWSNIKPEPKILNLSNKHLSNSEQSILASGLKFTPTPKRINLEETEEDINTFCRKLRLTEYFLDKKEMMVNIRI